MQYNLRCPFRIPEGHGLHGLDEPVEKRAGGLTYKVEKDNSFPRRYRLTVGPFDSKREVEDFFHDQMVFAFDQSVLCDYGCPFLMREYRDCLIFIKDVPGGKSMLGEEASVYGDVPCAVPIGIKTLSSQAGDASGVISSPADRFLQTIVDGAASDKRYPQDDAARRKQRIAMDLYRSHFTENSKKAKFLMLIMALECVSEKIYKLEEIKEMTKKWKCEVKKRMEEAKAGKEKEFLLALERLMSEQMLREEDSIRHKIRTMIQKCIDDEEEAEVQVKNFNKMYDVRSKLMHKGDADEHALSKSFEDARKLVRMVLRKKMNLD